MVSYDCFDKKGNLVVRGEHAACFYSYINNITYLKMVTKINYKLDVPDKDSAIRFLNDVILMGFPLQQTALEIVRDKSLVLDYSIPPREPFKYWTRPLVLGCLTIARYLIEFPRVIEEFNQLKETYKENTLWENFQLANQTEEITGTNHAIINPFCLWNTTWPTKYSSFEEIGLRNSNLEKINNCSDTRHTMWNLFCVYGKSEYKRKEPNIKTYKKLQQSEKLKLKREEINEYLKRQA